MAALLTVLCGCGHPQRPAKPGTTLTIAAASSMQFAMEDLLDSYRAAHPGVAVKAVYGSSGNLSAQIRNHAPFDLFFAADIEYPDKLAGEGLVLDGSVRCYAEGDLALWVPNASPVPVERLGMDALVHPAVEKIAIANPKLAPYGAAAVAALRHAGKDGEMAPKMVLGDNITQAAQFVESGAADIGILAYSHVMSPAMRHAGRYWLMPAASHPPIRHGMVILKQTGNPAGAGGFRDFVLGAEGRAILERHGFKPSSNG